MSRHWIIASMAGGGDEPPILDRCGVVTAWLVCLGAIK